MIKLLLFGCILGLFGSCVNPEEQRAEIPAGVLTPNQFADLLVDFSIAESATNLNIKSVSINKTDSVYAFNPLLQHHIRQSQYDSTLTFYAANSILYKAVYDTVLSRLSQLKVSRQKITPAKTE